MTLPNLYYLFAKTIIKGSVMNAFIQKHSHLVTNCLSGFDRLVIRGTLRNISYVEGMLVYLSVSKVLLKDFKNHVLKMSQLLKQASLAVVLAAGRPVEFLSSSKGVKEDLAKEIMQRDHITQGPICAFTCVEPCYSYIVVGNRAQQKLELKPNVRKCLFLYHYFIHPEFGFNSCINRSGHHGQNFLNP